MWRRTRLSLLATLAVLLLSYSAIAQKASNTQAELVKKLKRIKHVVVIYQENWSFDGLYGRFPGANGLSSPEAAITQVDKDGNPLQSLPQPLKDGAADKRFPPANGNAPLPARPYDLTQFVPPDQATGDLIHRFYHEQLQIDQGKMDKFVTWSDNGGLVVSFVDATNLPEGRLAQEFVLCDNFFHSAFGGSFLNHQYLIAAAAPQWQNAPPDQVSNPDPAHLKDLAVTPDGYAVNTVLSVNSPHSKKAGILLPQQTNETIGDRLSEKDVSWKWYAGGWNDALAGKGDDENFQFHHQPFVYYEKYKDGTKARELHLQDEKNFFADLSAGKLPAVSFIKPLGPDNEHPGYANVLKGQEHVAKLVDAVRKSKAWKSTLIIITYDENGGRWDHVPPPSGDRFGPGSRVPTIIVSPFAKRHFVDHTQYETLSILKLIELRFGLAPLHERDDKATPLINGLDFGR